MIFRCVRLLCGGVQLNSFFAFKNKPRAGLTGGANPGTIRVRVILAIYPHIYLSIFN